MRTHLCLCLAALTSCASQRAARVVNVDDGAANPIDEVVLPILTQAGITPHGEDPAILCRRIAIDLSGIAPTADETVGICNGHSAGDMADYFMTKTSGPNSPDGAPYVWVNRRAWADAFQYHVSTTDTGQTFYVYARDLDQMVADLYSGKIMYDEFARRSLASPAFSRRFGVFNANHDLVQIASQAFRVFLGREALPPEAEDFGNLWRAWDTHLEDEPTSEMQYPDCPKSILSAEGQPIGCRHTELGLYGKACSQAIGCATTLFGGGSTVPSQAAFVRWADLSAADLSALEMPGTLLAKQPEFAEAAVDRALSRLLGWWNAGVYRPDFELPAVRDTLVAQFSRTFDVRALDRTIVTSLLYTQATATKTPTTTPLWATGPVKTQLAETWLDSLGQALGKNLGGCDFRYLSAGYTNGSQIPGYFAFPMSTGVTLTYYPGAAQNLGGCPLAAPHTDNAGLVPAVSRRVVLARFCKGAFAPKDGEKLDDTIDRLFVGIGRVPSADERAAISTNLSDTMNGGCGASGCSQAALDGLCNALYASALQNYY